MNDLHNNVSVEYSVYPVVADADVDGATIDKSGYGAVEHVIMFGIEGITLSGTNKIECILQHGDESDASDMAAVTSADDYIGTMVDATTGKFFVADANADIPAVANIGYRGKKRYTRVVFDFSGTHGTGTPIAAVAVKGSPYRAGGSGVLS